MGGGLLAVKEDSMVDSCAAWDMSMLAWGVSFLGRVSSSSGGGSGGGRTVLENLNRVGRLRGIYTLFCAAKGRVRVKELMRLVLVHRLCMERLGWRMTGHPGGTYLLDQEEVD